jgi:3-hydroxybutyryl-CoA dehydrogenase
MGPGIALSVALAGYDVVLSGRSRESLDSALTQISAAVDLLLEAGLTQPEQASQARRTIRTEVGLESAARGSTYVVEAIDEDLVAKKALFAKLESLALYDPVFASISSGFMPSQLQEGLKHPERVLVTQYGQPAYLIPVCEVAISSQTSSPIVARTCDVLRACSVRPIVCKEINGFVWNRLQFAVLREALALLHEGIASAEDIESVWKYGYGARLPAMGPFEHADLVGIDLACIVGKTIWPSLDCSKDPSEGIMGEMLNSGRLGMKSGQGFYDWTKRDPAEFRRQRDLEIIRRVRLLRDQPVK